MLTQINNSSLEANMDIPHKQPKGKGKRANSTTQCNSSTYTWK
jgi:hypothetical protein